MRAWFERSLPVSITRLMVPVGAEISTAMVASKWPLGATCAGCIVASDGAHPAATPAASKAPAAGKVRAARRGARVPFTPHQSITPVNLPM